MQGRPNVRGQFLPTGSIGETIRAGAVLPEIDLYFSPDATATPSATQVVVFRWNGPSTDVTELDNGSAACAAWPFGVQYSGNVFWISGQRVIEQVSSSPTQGGSRRKFRLYSPNSSPDDVDVRPWYGTASNEYPCGESGANEAAELSDPSAGSMSSNTITGLDAADNAPPRSRSPGTRPSRRSPSRTGTTPSSSWSWTSSGGNPMQAKQVALIFHDRSGNEQLRVCYVPESKNPVLEGGRRPPADQVQAGDLVQLPDGSYRRVDRVERKD